MSLANISFEGHAPKIEPHIWRPKYSQQLQHERNCGQHCVAMITHLPVEIVCQELKKWRGTDTREVTGMLRWFGIECDVVKTRYKKGMTLPDLCIVHWVNHWAIHFKGMIYCSCTGIYTLQDLRHRIKGFIKVEIPTI